MSTAPPWRGDPALGSDLAYWWNLSGDWVETPNLRRSGWSGVLRARHASGLVYVKRQRNHLCRTWRHPFGWPTASREYENLRRVLALGLRAPLPLFHGSRRERDAVHTVLVTAALEGFAPLCEQRGLDLARRTALAREAGRVIGTMHAARLQHGCLYDKHIMVRWHGATPEIALLDLEKMRSRATRRAAAAHDLDQLQRHQQVWSAAEWALFRTSHAEAMGRPPRAPHATERTGGPLPLGTAPGDR